jgi:cytochrome c oxidase cbb3-type subunit 1
MTAQTTEPVPVRSETELAQPLPREIDYSGRIPLLMLITCGLVWLVFSFLVGVFASIKMHAPGMFAGAAALTYGRVAAVSASAFYYGFACEVGIAIALWLFTRLGKSYLIWSSGVFIAGLIWNFVLLLGIIGVFSGDMTQFAAYPMPLWTAPAFFVLFLVLGLSGILTYVSRTERDSYPSTWFLFAAFFAFAWILSAAWLLLGHYPVRGIFQPIVARWYGNNFIDMWLAPIALAIIFYFVSKLKEQPLHSYSLAAVGFWFYIAFAHASGFQNMAAIPNWMPSLSAVINVLLLLPVIAFAINWHYTKSSNPKKPRDISARYIAFSSFAFVSGAFLTTLISCPLVDEVVGLTIFIPGVNQWISQGFIAMAFFAAILHIAPRLTETDWPSAKLISGHFGLTVAGIVISVLALLIGGYVQGGAINDPSVPAVEISKKIIPFIGLGTLGVLLIFIGQLALLFNLLSMFKNACCCILPVIREATR